MAKNKPVPGVIRLPGVIRQDLGLRIDVLIDLHALAGEEPGIGQLRNLFDYLKETAYNYGLNTPTHWCFCLREAGKCGDHDEFGWGCNIVKEALPTLLFVDANAPNHPRTGMDLFAFNQLPTESWESTWELMRIATVDWAVTVAKGDDYTPDGGIKLGLLVTMTHDAVKFTPQYHPIYEASAPTDLPRTEE